MFLKHIYMTQKLCLHEHLVIGGFSSFLFNFQGSEISKLSFSKCMGRLVCLNSEILFSGKKELIDKPC